MEKQILQLLEMSADTYSKMVLNHFHKWCGTQSYDDTDCQKLLANPVLFNWWYKQYAQLEAKFATRAAEFFGKADKGVMRSYHAETVAAVQDFYCKPLINQARKQQPITPQFN